MTRIQFFALKGDLLAVLETVEQEQDGGLDYVRMGRAAHGLQRFARGGELPRLGEADQDTGSVCASFLIVMPSTPVAIRTVELNSGGQNSLVDQLLNPDSVVLTPAGLWQGSVLLTGEVSTSSNSSISQLLMRRFSKAFKRHFATIKPFQMGPQALAMLRSGGRLTYSAGSPREYDIAAARAEGIQTPSERKPAEKRKPAVKKTPAAKKKRAAKRKTAKG